jgi:hypothetical protein
VFGGFGHFFSDFFVALYIPLGAAMSQALVLFRASPSTCSDTEMEGGSVDLDTPANVTVACLPTHNDECEVLTDVVDCS